MGEKNRHFSREFRRDAVQLATEKGMLVGKVAKELDIHPKAGGEGEYLWYVEVFYNG